MQDVECNYTASLLAAIVNVAGADVTNHLASALVLRGSMVSIALKDASRIAMAMASAMQRPANATASRQKQDARSIEGTTVNMKYLLVRPWSVGSMGHAPRRKMVWRLQRFASARMDIVECTARFE